MTINIFSGKFFLLPRLPRQFFRQQLQLFLLALLISIPSVQASEENKESFVSEFTVLTEDNLSQYVSRMSQRYYEQVESLANYFQLYQQKRDPRGFNVWHLRGFSPNFTVLNDENKQIAMTNEAFLAERPEKALTMIFSGLREVSVNLMVAFRDNDPQAFKAANALVKEHSAKIATLLNEHNLDEEIREVSFN